jgi:superfamily I DNA/RNA helicase
MLEEQAMIDDTSLIDILEKTMKENSNIKVTPMAKKGIQEFLAAIKEIKEHIAQHRPAEVIEKLVKKIKYREYLVKEEGGEVQADEKYENIGQLINMAEKYVETGEETLRQFLEEVALLSDISENEK